MWYVVAPVVASYVVRWKYVTRSTVPYVTSASGIVKATTTDVTHSTSEHVAIITSISKKICARAV